MQAPVLESSLYPSGHELRQALLCRYEPPKQEVHEVDMVEHERQVLSQAIHPVGSLMLPEGHEV